MIWLFHFDILSYCFADVERATEAHRLVHGYQLKGRPMIIQYGKNTTNRAESNDSDTTSVKT